MNEIIITALTTGLVSTVVTWFAARRKNLAEAQSNELDNVNKAVRYYKEMLDDIANRHSAAMEELKVLKKQMTSLEERIRILAEENRSLMEELKKYKQLNGKSK